MQYIIFVLPSFFLDHNFNIFFCCRILEIFDEDIFFNDFFGERNFRCGGIQINLNFIFSRIILSINMDLLKSQMSNLANNITCFLEIFKKLFLFIFIFDDKIFNINDNRILISFIYRNWKLYIICILNLKIYIYLFLF